ncbi:drug resistance protein [Pochonia chlamydosporia 170]|uniref:Drug resistance protein n=1 Tax=Pochonia chlamydosporia 170 TaxID=1380566 RepID=A0A179G3T6_METCM|nr:drug resistance protein [Pochonia chlamydosporia 170]OAQ72534.1 drug resistance protein [Pochonia chlamydosporia 170]
MDSTHNAQDETQAELPMSKARCIALVATVTGAAFVNVLNIQSVVIILPTIGNHLDIPESRQQWIVSSYSLAFGCFLLLWGRIGDIYGKRLIFILGSVWVTCVTAANPFIPNEIGFNLFRGFQGLGAAATVPTAIGILGVTFPPGKAKNYAFSTYGAGAPLGSVCGNLLSGLIAEYANWKWVFGALAILSAIITTASIFLIPPPPPSVKLADTDAKAPPQKVDWLGATLITIALIALNFSLTEGNVVGWSTPWVPVLVVTAVLLIALFTTWQMYLERRHGRNLSRAPLIKVSVFRNARFSAAMLIMGLFFTAFNNYLIFTTYFFQDFQGLSPLSTMLRYIPTGVTGVIVALIVAQLLSRIPTLFILVCGTLATSVACLLYAVPIAPTTSYWAYGFPAMVLAVMGADTVWPCLTLFTSQALPREDQAIGGALINAVGQFGRSIGLAVGTAIQTAAMARERGVPVMEAGPTRPWDGASLTGLRAANWANFGFGVAALVVVLLAFRNMDIIGKTRPARVAETESSGGVFGGKSHDVEQRATEKK